VALEGDIEAAFVAGNGGIASAELWMAIAMILMTLVLLWQAWVAWGHFQAWMDEDTDADGWDFFWAVVRAAIWSMLLGWLAWPSS
jgi:integrating conjugative element protein (TIGR03758 family)